MKTCKRQVRCTICTSYRWMGNAKERFKAKEQATKKRMIKEIRNATD